MRTNDSGQQIRHALRAGNHVSILPNDNLRIEQMPKLEVHFALSGGKKRAVWASSRVRRYRQPSPMAIFCDRQAHSLHAVSQPGRR
jgi:hypothetical protein